MEKLPFEDLAEIDRSGLGLGQQPPETLPWKGLPKGWSNAESVLLGTILEAPGRRVHRVDVSCASSEGVEPDERWRISQAWTLRPGIPPWSLVNLNDYLYVSIVNLTI